MMDELHKQLDVLRLSMDQDAVSNAIISCVPALVVCMEENLRGRIVFATPLMESMFGYIDGELLGMSVQDLIPEEKRERHESHLAGYARHPASRQMGSATMELRGRHKDGTTFPVEIGLHPKVISFRKFAIATVVKSRA